MDVVQRPFNRPSVIQVWWLGVSGGRVSSASDTKSDCSLRNEPPRLQEGWQLFLSPRRSLTFSHSYCSEIILWASHVIFFNLTLRGTLCRLDEYLKTLFQRVKAASFLLLIL